MWVKMWMWSWLCYAAAVAGQSPTNAAGPSVSTALGLEPTLRVIIPLHVRVVPLGLDENDVGWLSRFSLMRVEHSEADISRHGLSRGERPASGAKARQAVSIRYHVDLDVENQGYGLRDYEAALRASARVVGREPNETRVAVDGDGVLAEVLASGSSNTEEYTIVVAQSDPTRWLKDLLQMSGGEGNMVSSSSNNSSNGWFGFSTGVAQAETDSPCLVDRWVSTQQRALLLDLGSGVLARQRGAVGSDAPAPHGPALRSAVQRAVRSVLVPPSSLSHYSGADGHAAAETVLVDLFVLDTHGGKYDPMGGGTLSRALQEGVESMSLGTQRVAVTPHVLSARDDPHLAMAYAAAVRGGGGTGDRERVLSVDAATLHSYLHHVDAEPAQRRKAKNARVRTRTVTVVLLSLDVDRRVLVDGRAVSVAVGSTIVAVQNRPQRRTMRHTCNGGRHVQYNPRDPSPSILASVARVLGGSLPGHLVSRTDGHVDVHEDWSWCVGSGPLSNTALPRPAPLLAVARADAMHRNHIAHALQHAVGVANAAQSLLSRIDSATHAAREALDGRRLRLAILGAKREYDEALGGVVRAMESLDHTAAIGFAETLERSANQYSARANEVADVVRACGGVARADAPAVAWTLRDAAALVAVAALLVSVRIGACGTGGENLRGGIARALGRRPRKVKLN